jgi:hypothetical protein
MRLVKTGEYGLPAAAPGYVDDDAAWISGDRCTLPVHHALAALVRKVCWIDNDGAPRSGNPLTCYVFGDVQQMLPTVQPDGSVFEPMYLPVPSLDVEVVCKAFEATIGPGEVLYLGIVVF